MRVKRIPAKPNSSGTSHLESHLAFAIKVAKLPLPEREYKFHVKRKWRFDFAWPELKIAAECEGGTWTRGAHSRGQHYASDCEKYNEAALLGWRVLRFTTDMVKDGAALKTLKCALRPEGVGSEGAGNNE